MGLIDKLKSKFVSADGTFNPPDASFATRPDTTSSHSAERRTTNVFPASVLNSEILPRLLMRLMVPSSSMT